MTEKVIETKNGWYMENPKEKVELDDIIGLVKTDEPTDSVTLKKEAQLSICEKRVLRLEKENEELKSTIAQLIEQNRKNNDLLLSDIRILEKALWCSGCENDFKRLKELRREFIR